MKYKLIKEYPGSPKLGEIIKPHQNSFYFVEGEPLTETFIKAYPEFWEKVVEKDYEILLLKYIKNDNWLHDYKKGQIVECRLHNDGHLEFKTNKGSWDSYSQEKGFQKIMSEVFSIHSVKRLSDGEIFTIGDKIQTSMTLTINGFIIIDNELLIDPFEIIGTVALNKISKSKQPLFTTKDGVDIFEEDCIYFIHPDNFKLVTIKVTNRIKIGNHTKLFSTKEKAEEYIIMNKPVLSLKDVASIYPGINKSHPDKPSSQSEQLKNLVKLKIQQSV